MEHSFPHSETCARKEQSNGKMPQQLPKQEIGSYMLTSQRAKLSVCSEKSDSCPSI